MAEMAGNFLEMHEVFSLLRLFDHLITQLEENEHKYLILD